MSFKQFLQEQTLNETAEDIITNKDDSDAENVIQESQFDKPEKLNKEVLLSKNTRIKIGTKQKGTAYT